MIFEQKFCEIYLFLIEGTKTIKFKPGSLGMSVRWGEGVVTNMDQGSQAEKLGVEVGWKLIKFKKRNF